MVIGKIKERWLQLLNYIKLRRNGSQIYWSICEDPGSSGTERGRQFSFFTSEQHACRKNYSHNVSLLTFHIESKRVRA